MAEPAPGTPDVTVTGPARARFLRPRGEFGRAGIGEECAASSLWLGYFERSRGRRENVAIS